MSSIKRCVACYFKESEKHHFKTRGSGGTDDDWNILYLCRRCHTEIHAIGNTRFVEKHPAVKSWLINNGWIICEVRKKWKRY